MFISVVGVIVLCLGFLLQFGYWFLKQNKDEETCYNEGAMFCYIITIIIVGVAIIITMFGFSSQKSDNEKLIMLSNKGAIYREKAEILTKEFAGYLAEAYPKYEKNIFEKISPDKIDFYLVKYPELQASQTILELVQQIAQLRGDFYEQSLLKEDVLKSMRYRPKNPWLLYWFIPTIEDLQNK